MCYDKIKLFFAQRKLFKHLLFFVIFIGFIAVTYIFLFRFNAVSPNYIGIAGTLIGAIVGGFFTLIGSIMVNNRQVKAQMCIKRKNIIFKPLYDELVGIHNYILVKNPYPNSVIFNKKQQALYSNPQYTVWHRIKSDSRLLETPDKLVKKVDVMYLTIERYCNIRNQCSQVIVNTLNSVLNEEISNSSKNSNIGEIFANNVFGKNFDNIFKSRFLGLENKVEYSEDIQCYVSNKFYKECYKNKIVNEVVDIYNEWQKQEEEIIEFLSVMIKIVNAKYEG